MKRYRLSTFFLDTSRNVYKLKQTPVTKAMRDSVRESMSNQYGGAQFQEKFNRYVQLEKPSISIVAEHTTLLEDVCNAYIHGDLYSALTGACCLGERMFNDILFKTMGDFKSSTHYKYMYGRGSVIDWEKAIEILADWNLIDEETKKQYLRLYKLRTNSVHYQKKQQNLAEMALSAINIVNFVINKLFAINEHTKNKLIYFEVPGELFIKKDAETNPLVKAFFIPCSTLVGYKYKTESGSIPGQFRIVDDNTYEDKEITDAEFVNLRNEYTNKKKG